MITYSTSTDMVEGLLVLPFLSSLTQYYPDFEYWYVNQVIPGIATGKDVLLLAKDNNHIVGIALGKQTDEEQKLRCVRVLPDYQKTGVGVKLIDRMLAELQSTKPVVTVAEEMLHLYSRLFVTRYGFSLDDVTKGDYRKQKLEYYFNLSH